MNVQVTHAFMTRDTELWTLCTVHITQLCVRSTRRHDKESQKKRKTFGQFLLSRFWQAGRQGSCSVHVHGSELIFYCHGARFIEYVFILTYGFADHLTTVVETLTLPNPSNLLAGTAYTKLARKKMAATLEVRLRRSGPALLVPLTELARYQWQYTAAGSSLMLAVPRRRRRPPDILMLYKVFNA